MTAPVALIVISRPMPGLPVRASRLSAPGTNVHPPSTRPPQNNTSAARSADDHSQISPAPSATPDNAGTTMPRSRHHGAGVVSVSSPPPCGPGVTVPPEQPQASLMYPPALRGIRSRGTRDPRTARPRRRHGAHRPPRSAVGLGQRVLGAAPFAVGRGLGSGRLGWARGGGWLWRGPGGFRVLGSAPRAVGAGGGPGDVGFVGSLMAARNRWGGVWGDTGGRARDAAVTAPRNDAPLAGAAPP